MQTKNFIIITFRKMYFYLALALCVFLFGCGREDAKVEPELNAEAVSKTIDAMDPADIIVAINSDKFTKSDYEQMLVKVERQFRLRKPNTQPAFVKAYLNNRKRTLITEYINRQLLLNEAVKRAVEVSSAEVQKGSDAAIANFKSQGKTLEQMLAYMGDTQAEFQQNVREGLMIKALLAQEFGENRDVVTDEELNEYRKGYEKYNSMCNATNELVLARGRKIIEELNAGADFNTVALAYTEEEGLATGYWGEFLALEIDDESVRKAAFEKPVGAVAGPFDTEEGLVIIKILDQSVKASEDDAKEKVARLGRIILKMAENTPCPNDQELRKEILIDRRENQMLPFLENLRKNAAITYPNGTNFWPVTTQTGALPFN